MIEGARHSNLVPCLIPGTGPEDLNVCRVGVRGVTGRGSIGKRKEKKTF